MCEVRILTDERFYDPAVADRERWKFRDVKALNCKSIDCLVPSIIFCHAKAWLRNISEALACIVHKN